jgi:hypothetical protein
MQRLKMKHFCILTTVSLVLVLLLWFISTSHYVSRLLGPNISYDEAFERAVVEKNASVCLLINEPGEELTSYSGDTSPTSVEKEQYNCITRFASEQNTPEACQLLKSKGIGDNEILKRKDGDNCLLSYVRRFPDEGACQHVSESVRPACKYSIACQQAAAQVADHQQIDGWHSCALREFESDSGITQLVHFAYGIGGDCMSGCIFQHMCAVIDRGEVYTKEESLMLGYPEELWQGLPTDRFVRDENTYYTGTSFQMIEEWDTEFRWCD